VAKICAVAALAAPALAGCGDDEPAETTAATDTTTAADATVTEGAPPEPPAERDPKPKPGADKPPADKPVGPAEDAEHDPRLTGLEREAMRTVSAFVAALDRRDGKRACELLAPQALTEIELPRPKGDCATSLEASIGYRDPRGVPVWESARATRVSPPQIDGETAKLVATVVTRFADRDEVSVEDDIVYLTRAGDGWVIAKPSSTLYRAVGIADVPPTVLSPP
jgi:hypothetical protein